MNILNTVGGYLFDSWGKLLIYPILGYLGLIFYRWEKTNESRKSLLSNIMKYKIDVETYMSLTTNQMRQKPDLIECRYRYDMLLQYLIASKDMVDIHLLKEMRLLVSEARSIGYINHLQTNLQRKYLIFCLRNHSDSVRDRCVALGR